MLDQFLKSTLKNRFLRKSFIYIFIANISNTLLGFILAVILSRVLQVDGYGKYSYVLYLLSFFAFLSLPGIATMITQTAANNRDKFLENGTRTRIKFSILGSICIAAFAVVYLNKISLQISIALIIGAVFFPFYICLNSFFYFLNGKRLYSHYCRISIIENLAVFLFTASAAIITRDFFWAVLAYIITKTILDGILYLHTIKKFKKNEEDDPQAERVGRHFSFVSIIGLVGNNFDKVIIGTLMSFAALAIYTIADLISSQLKIFNTIMDTYLFPVISKEDAATAHRKMPFRIVTSTFLFGIVAAAAALAATILIPIFFTHKYIESIPFMHLLILAIVISFPGGVLTTYFRAQKMVGETYIVKTAESISYIVALCVLVLPYKVIGIIWAIIIANTCYTLASIFCYLRVSFKTNVLYYGGSYAQPGCEKDF